MNKEFGNTISSLVDFLKDDGRAMAIKMKGFSMFPTLRPGDTGIVTPCEISTIQPGDIVVFKQNNSYIAHRLKSIKYLDGKAQFICRGDNNSSDDYPCGEKQFIGIINEFERKNKKYPSPAPKLFLTNPGLFYKRNRLAFRLYSLTQKTENFREIYFNQWKIILGNTRKDLLQNLLITFFQSVLPLAMIYFVKLIVDYLSVDKSEINLYKITALLIAAGLSYLFNGILGEIKGYYQEKLTQSVSKYTYKYIQDIHKELELKNYEIPDSLNLIHQAAYESSFRPMRMISNGMNLFRAVISSLLILAMFISVDWNFIFILVLAILPRLLLKIRFARKFFHFRKSQSADERAMFYFNRVITSQPFAKEMRLFDLTEIFRDKFNHTQERLHKGKLKILASELTAASLAQLFGIGLIFYALGKLIFGYVDNTVTLGSLVLVFFLFQRAFSTLNELFQSVANLVEDYHFLKILKSFEELLTPKASKKEISTTNEFKELKIENLNFCYPQNQKKVLQHINLSLSPNQTIALVGANGSGKTTLIKLLAGLYEVQDGKISMNGVNYNNLPYKELQSKITAVFQDYAMYNITAAENISLGNIHKPYDSEKIKRAATQADMDESISKFPNKYHQMIGNYFQDGIELSIGQWQKMAIARALYSDAPLLLLDEPTSALDAVSELHITELMRKMTHNRTTIIVSHQLSMVEWVDKIYCLKEGVIVEEGKHSELLALNGEYARLYTAHHHLKS